MVPAEILTLALGIAASAAGSLGYEAMRRIVRGLSGKEERQETIEDRVKRLTKSLEEATHLIGNIESEIKARSGLASQLQKDINQYDQLVQL